VVGEQHGAEAKLLADKVGQFHGQRCWVTVRPSSAEWWTTAASFQAGSLQQPMPCGGAPPGEEGGHARGWCSGDLGVAEKQRQTTWRNGARSRVAAEWSESMMRRRNSFLRRWDAVEDKATHIGSARGWRRSGDLVWSMRSLLERCLGAHAELKPCGPQA
jgi:hypothetical protein